jgi:protein-S-isoprenylcysteine O-methyltransferase Ste14
VRLEWLELRVPPVAVTALMAAAIVAIEHSRAASILTHPGIAPKVGAALAAAGVVVAVAGAVVFRRAGTTVDPLHPERSARLVTGGVYRASRNPMYVGFVVVLVGLAVALSSLVGVALALATGVYLDRFQIQPEERTLLQCFGRDFERYRREVPRWLW